MPTLREDIIEARDRVIEARKPLVEKLAKGIEWSRDEHIQAIDGMDSLVTMADETLPYLTNYTQNGAPYMTSTDPAPIVPIGTQTGYKTTFPNRAGTVGKAALNFGSLCGPEAPGHPDGFDSSRPNVVLDPKTGNFVFTDVDFTGDNAGSSERDFIASAYVFLPTNQWGDVVFSAVSPGDDNRVISPKEGQRFEIRQSPFMDRIDFNMSLSGAPRSGGKDWFRIMVEWHSQYPQEEPTLNIGTDRGINLTTGVFFFLPGTVHNKYRDVHIYTRQPNGDPGHEIISSVNEITEHDGFVWYRGDEGWPVKIVNSDDIVGTWFVPGDKVNPHFMYDIHSDVAGGELGVQADALTLGDNGRFAVMRQGHMDGWLNADRTYEITPKKL